MKSRKFKSSQKRRFGMESLEDRRLMAGDMAAVLYGNTIYLSEAAGHAGEANDVIVSQLANGQISVKGNTAHGTPNKINGLAEVKFTPAAGQLFAISANMGGGADQVHIYNAKLNAIGVNTSAANAGVNDVDMVDIQNVNTKYGADISTGDGVDNVVLQNVKIGDGSGPSDLNIKTGKGWDYVQVGNTSQYNDVKGSVNITTYDNLNAEADGATVKVQLTTAKDYIRSMTDNGVDNVEMVADFAGQDILVDAQGGKDTVTLRECQAADQFFVLLGKGDDTLDMTYIRANTFFADGGEGVDTLKHQQDGPTNGTVYQNFETGANFVAPRVGGVGTVGAVSTTPVVTSSNAVGAKGVGSKSLIK